MVSLCTIIAIYTVGRLVGLRQVYVMYLQQYEATLHHEKQ